MFQFKIFKITTLEYNTIILYYKKIQCYYFKLTIIVPDIFYLHAKRFLIYKTTYNVSINVSFQTPMYKLHNIVRWLKIY